MKWYKLEDAIIVAGLATCAIMSLSLLLFALFLISPIISIIFCVVFGVLSGYFYKTG